MSPTTACSSFVHLLCCQASGCAQDPEDRTSLPPGPSSPADNTPQCSRCQELQGTEPCSV
jgi:hypothetical protein